MKLSTAGTPSPRRCQLLLTASLAAPLSIVFGLVIPPEGHAQSPQARQKFEVASIRLSTCNDSGPAARAPGRMTAPPPGRLTRECAHLRDLIQQAYGHHGLNL